MKVYRILNEIISVLPVIPIYYLGKQVYSQMEKEIRIYWIFLTLSFLYVIGITLAARNNIHNVFSIVLFQTLEYTLLSVIFYMWNSNKIIKILIVFFVIFNWITWIYYFTGNDVDYSRTVDKYLRNFVLIPLSFYTAYRYAVNSKTELLTDIKFWFIAGILVNVTLTAFAQIFQSLAYNKAQWSFVISLFYLTINTISCIMFIKGLLCLKIKMKYTGS